MLHKIIIPAGLVLYLLVAAVPATPGAGLPLAVSIPPQAYFLKRIAGDSARIQVLVPPGREPHNYDPTPKQLADLSKCRALFLMGVPFEKALLPKLKANFPRLKLVNTISGIKLRLITPSEAGQHAHHHAEKTQAKAAHGHAPKPAEHQGEPDPHTWMDPVLVKQQAANMARALKELDPARAAEYERNLKSFQADLDELNARLAKVLAPVKGKTLMVFHPAFGYFSDRYGLKQKAIETGGRSPGPKHLAHLIKEAKEHGAKVIFVQPEFSKESARALAQAIKGVVASLDPLARDYMQNLQDAADRIAAALK
ncbi:MAG: zinc ABC transporter substrate-binding protein [Desulfarculaceae bacterium]|jgi:zinc transport system substrate-binding protein